MSYSLPEMEKVLAARLRSTKRNVRVAEFELCGRAVVVGDGKAIATQRGRTVEHRNVDRGERLISKRNRGEVRTRRRRRENLLAAPDEREAARYHRVNGLLHGKTGNFHTFGQCVRVGPTALAFVPGEDRERLTRVTSFQFIAGFSVGLLRSRWSEYVGSQHR